MSLWLSISQLQKALFVSMIFLLPMSVTQWNKYSLILVLGISVLLFLFQLFTKSHLRINRLYLIVFVSYLGIFLVGLVSLFVSSASPFGMEINTDTLGRIVNVTILSTVLLIGFHWISGASDKDIMGLKGIWLAPGMMFFIFALYQIYCNLTGQTFFIETRDWMHGVPDSLRSVVPKRITSIAEEPSFFAPIIVEFGILVVFLFKNYWLKVFLLTLSSVILLMTFSAGAYINASLLCIFAYILFLIKQPRSNYHFVVLILLILFASWLLIYGQVLIEFAINKLSHESSGGSSRSQFMSNLTNMIFNSDIMRLLFGHGVTSLSFLNDFGMREEDVLFRISNNMFVDILWESGVLGLLSTGLMYLLLFSQAGKIQYVKKNGLSLSLLLSIQLLITSIYRSEYISTHMIWMLLLIVWAIKWETVQLQQLVIKQNT